MGSYTWGTTGVRIMISVLYVDDEPMLLEILKIMLESTEEFKVGTALSAAEGLAALRYGQYDAIVSDYQMPIMDGIEFLQEVRASFGDIPFIIFTGRGREDIVIEALNCGADFYLQKGGEPKAQFAELAHKIRSAVQRRKTEAALYESRNFLNNVFTSIPDGISVVDRDLTILRVNKSMEDWYPGAVPLVGKRCYEAYHGRSERCENCPSWDTLISERSAGCIISRKKEGGSTGWFELLRYPLIDSATGTMTGVIEYVRDVTARKEADDELREAHERLTLSDEELRQQCDELACSNQMVLDREAQLHRIVKAAPWGMYICELDGTGALILREANPEADQIMGRDHSRYIGKPLGEVCEALAETEFPERVRDFALNGGQWINEQFSHIRNGLPTVFDFRAFSIVPGWIVVAFEDVTERKKAEAALAESERKFREIFDRANDGIHLHEIQDNGLPGKFLEVNEVACRMLQATREELLSLSPLDFATGYHSLSLAEIGRNFIANGHAEFETEFTRKDGTILPVEINAHSIKIMGKTRVLSVIRDISVQKRARLELEKSRQHLEAIVQCSPVPMFVIDNEHHVISWNHAIEEFTGRTACEALGMVDTGRVFYQRDHPCLADLIVDDTPDEILRIYEQKVVPSGYIRGAYEVVDFFPHINGGSWITITAAPVRDHSGQIIGAVEMLRDITDKRKRDEELLSAYQQLQAAFDEVRMSQDLLQEQNWFLSQSESRYQIFMETSQDIIWEVDNEGRFTFISPLCETYLGHTPQELIGKHGLSLVSSEQVGPVKRSFEKAVANKLPVFSFEIPVCHRNGSRILLNVCTMPIWCSEGTFLGFRGSARDISERERMEDHIRKEQKNVERLFSASPAGFLLVNENVEIVDANQKILSLVGRKPEEVRGKRAGGGLGCIHSTEVPEGCGFSGFCRDCPLRYCIETALRENAGIPETEISLSLVVDNSLREFWFRISADPVEINGGRHIVITLEDITGTGSNEQDSRGSKDRSRTLVHASGFRQEQERRSASS